MNQREIDRWRKALEFEDKLWRGQTTYQKAYDVWNSSGARCPFCKIAEDECTRSCLITRVMRLYCTAIVKKAFDSKSRRPIYAAIRKMHRYLDDQEAKNKTRRKGK